MTNESAKSPHDRLFVGDMQVPGGVEWAPAVGHLVISGERSQEHEDRHEGVYRSERIHGHFHRVIALPEGAEADQATATFKNGVLEITMPLTARHHPRRLPVQNATSTGAA